MTASFHVASTGTATATSTTNTITLPATLTAGDLMIIAAGANFAVTSVATSHTTFTKLASAQATNDTTATCEVWYAYAAGTSGTSTDASSTCTVTCGTSSYPCTAFAAYSNAAISSPIDSSATDHTTGATDVTTIPCTGATTASANVLPISAIGGGGASASPTLTAPSGYTIRSQFATGDFEAVAIADATAISASGTGYGTGSWTYGGGGGGATVTFGIKAVVPSTTSTGSVATATLAVSATGNVGLPVTVTSYSARPGLIRPGAFNPGNLGTAAGITSTGSVAAASSALSGAGTDYLVSGTGSIAAAVPAIVAAGATGLLLTNSFEEGTSGTTLTTSNTGGVPNNAFDAVSVGTGTTLAFDSAEAAHGLLSLKTATGTTSTTTVATWSTSLGTQTTVYFRAYLYYTANPGSSSKPITFWAGATRAANLQITPAGKPQVLNGSSGAAAITFADSIPLNQWFRIEGFVTGNSSTGAVQLTLYDTMDSTTSTETHLASSLNTTGSITRVDFGETFTSVASIGPFWIDDIALYTGGLIGPLNTAVNTSGGVSLASLALTGTGQVPITGTGSVAGATYGFGATGAETFSGSGSLAGHAYSIASSATLTFSGSGTVASATQSISASGSEIFTGSGSVAGGSYGVAATAGNTSSGTGNVNNSSYALSGTGTETFSGSGSVSLALPGISGTASVPLPITSSGSVTAATWALSAAGAGGNTTSSGTFTSGAWTPAASAAETFTGTGSVAGHALAVSGTGAGGDTTSSGTITAASRAVSGTGTEVFTGTGSVAGAGYVLTSAGGQGESFSGGIAGASRAITASGFVALVTTGGVAAHTYALSGTAAMAINSTGSVTLPSFAEDGSSIPSPSWNIGGAYTLLFEDDFTETSLDTTNTWTLGWQAKTGVSGPVNATPVETAAYNSTNVTLPGDGTLHLKMTNTSSQTGYPYTGACVTTNPTTMGSGKGFQFTYGAAEARVYLPADPSTGLIANWPAWWTDGQSWPTDGEIDILEGLGGTAQFHMNSTLDQPAIGGPAPNQVSANPYAGGWHNYGVNWTSTQLDYYFDGVLVGSITAGVTGQPMYLIFDYTTGEFGGPLAFSDMQVDWVRVWDAGTTAAIPSVSTLVDSFSSSSTLASIWNFSTQACSISSGQAVVPCDVDYESLQTGTIYNLTGSSVYAKVTPAAGSGCDTYMVLLDGAANNTSSDYDTIYWFYEVGSTLQAAITQAGTNTTVGTLTYSGTTHAWWRLRESGGTIFWDTSSDGSTWTNRFSHSHSMAVTGLYLQFLSGAEGAVTTDNTLIDNVNGGGFTGTGTVGMSALALHSAGLKSDNIGSGTIGGAAFGVLGTANDVITGTATFRASVFTLQSQGGMAYACSGSLAAAAMAPVATVSQIFSLTGGCAMPAYDVTPFSGTETFTSTGSPVLAVLAVTGSGTEVFTSSGSLSMATRGLAATSAEIFTGTGAAHEPVLALHSAGLGGNTTSSGSVGRTAGGVIAGSGGQTFSGTASTNAAYHGLSGTGTEIFMARGSAARAAYGIHAAQTRALADHQFNVDRMKVTGHYLPAEASTEALTDSAHLGLTVHAHSTEALTDSLFAVRTINLHERPMLKDTCTRFETVIVTATFGWAVREQVSTTPAIIEWSNRKRVSVTYIFEWDVVKILSLSVAFGWDVMTKLTTWPVTIEWNTGQAVQGYVPMIPKSPWYSTYGK